MPRYALSDDERAALLRYLHVIGTEAAPVRGVTTESVRLGTVLPLGRTQSSAAEQALRGMTARIDQINASGGVFGRRLELIAVDSASEGIEAAVRRVIEEQGVFALVGVWHADPSPALVELLTSTRTASVAALAQSVNPISHHLISYLLPSVAQQVDGAVAVLKERCGPDGRSTVWFASASLERTVLPPQVADVSPQPQRYTTRVTDSAQALASEMDHLNRNDKVVALLPAAQVDGMRPAIERAGACAATLVAISGVSREAATPHQVPIMPIPVSALNPHGAFYSLGNAAIGVIAESMARAGRVLDLDTLLTAQNSLRRFEVAPGLRVSYGPTARHGISVGTDLLEGSSP